MQSLKNIFSHAPFLRKLLGKKATKRKTYTKKVEDVRPRKESSQNTEKQSPNVLPNLISVQETRKAASQPLSLIHI